MLMPFSAALAEGSGSHGGDAIQLSDDRIVLADSFLKANSGGGDVTEGGKRFVIYPELRSELDLISDLLGSYGCRAGQLFDFLKSHHSCGFVTDDILNDKETEYYLVDQIDQPECPNRAQYNVPPGAKLLESAACTYGGRTYLKTSLFSAMSIREQAKLIIHERLRSLPKAPFLKDIAIFTTGVDTMLTIYFEQRANNWRALTDEELNNLRGLFAKIRSFKFSDPREAEGGTWVPTAEGITRQGGGQILIKSTRLGEGSYVGMGSTLDTGGTVEKNVKLLQTDLRAGDSQKNNSVIGAGTSFFRSRVYAAKMVIGILNDFKNMEVDAGPLFQTGSHSQFEGSLRGQSVIFGAHNRFLRSYYTAYSIRAEFETGDDVSILDSRVAAFLDPENKDASSEILSISIEEGASLSWVDFSSRTSRYAFGRRARISVEEEAHLQGTKTKRLECPRERRYLAMLGQAISSNEDFIAACTYYR